MTVNNGANISTTDTNAISLGNNASITIGSGSGAAAVVQTTTTADATDGQYGTGSNTIEFGSGSQVIINKNGSLIATGSQITSEAINPLGYGNTIVNYGLIQGGPSSAIFFQNVGVNPGDSPNVVDNYGIIRLMPTEASNPVTGGQAVGSFGLIGINLINETGAQIIGNLALGGGNDNVTLNPRSTISGNFDGGPGINTLTLNAVPASADTFAGQVANFQVLTKTGAGLWTLTGTVGDNSAGGGTPLQVNIIGGTLALSGDNAAFNGSIVVNPGVNLATAGGDRSATLEARAQSLPPLITDHGIVLFNQVSPDGIQPADGTYSGLIQGSGVVTKIGAATLTLSPGAGGNTYSGGTNFNAGAILVSADNALGAASGPLAFGGGILRFGTSFNLAATRAITLNAGGGTFDINGQSTTVSQGITGAGGLTKAGSGVLTLTGTSTYTGGTAIGAGTLRLGNGGTSGSIAGNVADNGTLVFNRSDAVTFGGVVSGTGAVTQAGSGITLLTASNPVSGPTSVLTGTLAVGDATHTGASISGGGGVTVASGTTLGGYGSVSGAVVSSGIISAANALPAFAGGPVGRFSINGNLTNNGLVNVASTNGTGNVLAVSGNYVGGAGSTVALSTVLNAGGPLSNQFTDRVLIGGTADPSVVRVTAVGTGASTATESPNAASGISIVQVAGASAAGAFTLAGGAITANSPYVYTLNAYGPGLPNGPAYGPQSLVGNTGGFTDYRLQTAFVSPAGIVAPSQVVPAGNAQSAAPVNARAEVSADIPSYISAPTMLFGAGFQDLDSLHRRLGEIRDYSGQADAPRGEVFVRAYGSNLAYDSDRSFTAYGFNARSDHAATQFGANGFAVDDASGTLRVGLAATLGRTWSQTSAVDGTSKSLFNSETVAGIATWQSTAGWYVDAIVSGGLLDGRITTPGTNQGGGVHGTSIAGSLEGGYPVAIGGDFSFEPQAQVVLQHYHFSNGTDARGVGIDLGSPTEGILRAGFRVVRPIDIAVGGTQVIPYGKANGLQGIGGGSEVRVGGVGFTSGAYGTALQVGGGVTGKLDRDLSIYGEVAWQSSVGGAGFSGWVYNAGLRYTFGHAPAAAAAAAVIPPAPAAVARSYMVFFDWDREDLTGRAQQIVAQAAANVHRVAVTRISVNGYTDTSGRSSYNRALSERRAKAVASELTRDGIAADMIVIRGFGETHLLVPTGPHVREPRNRRVEILI